MLLFSLILIRLVGIVDEKPVKLVVVAMLLATVVPSVSTKIGSTITRPVDRCSHHRQALPQADTSTWNIYLMTTVQAAGHLPHKTP